MVHRNFDHGHLFIINGDLTKLACDAILVPTDDNFRIESYWHDVVPHERLPLQWGTDSVMRLPTEFRKDSADKGKVGVWLANIGFAGDQSGFDAYESTIREYITAARARLSRDRTGCTGGPNLALHCR